MRILIFSILFVTTSVLGVEPTSIGEMDSISWKEIEPGVWSGQVGEVDPFTFRTTAGGTPKTDALSRLGATPFPFANDATRGETSNGRTSVRLPLQNHEKIYGLGMQFRNMNRRGQVYHQRTDHYGGLLGRTHAPVPFYISSDGYGVLFNTIKWISVYPGVGNRKDSRLPTIRDRTTDPKWQAVPTSDAVEASAMTDGMEILVFAGPTPLEVVQRYNLYFGGGALVPRWGLGFWHRTPTSASDEQVTAEVDEFKKRDFPLDVIGLEPGWQSYAYPGSFDWSPKRFPDPSRFLNDMGERNLHVNLWENPYVSPNSSIYDDMLPLTGSHLVWLGVVPDYTLPDARSILQKHHTKTHLDIGVSGYKIDEVDGIDNWLWPDHATFPSGHSAEQMRQTYGLLMQQMLTEIFRKQNTRTYGLVRGSNAGASAYPFAIYSDHYSHKGYVTALCNSSLSGVLWTPEIRSARTEEEWVRRMQTVCFSPLAMLNAWSSGTKPWSMPEVSDIIRDTMKWRIRFLPYLYTAFAKYHFEGIPPFRAMVLESDDAKFANVTDQYMMGDSIMVAPLFAGQKKRSVVLPEGNWYDFHTNQFAGNGTTITIEGRLDRIPLFVKGGAIIPLLQEGNNTSKWDSGVPLEIRHYGLFETTTELYDDDGSSFDYEGGEYSWYTVTASKTAAGEWTGSIERTTGDFPQTFGDVHWNFVGTSKLP
jgi:alpha-D-xyloside xylohydrolase